MRAPEFWRRGRGGALAALLSPLGHAYGLAGRVRYAAATPWRAPPRVLCVGNIVAGGAGKTPVALSLGARLAERGMNVHFLTRGYGGAEAGPLRVDPGRHGPGDVGDEALLLARRAPAWVAADRKAGARAAARGGADLVVMDDGFQNPHLVKDVSLLVVDGGYGFGNGRVHPAGPLRETVAGGLARADALVLIGPDDAGVADQAARAGNLPLLRAQIRPGPEALKLAGQRVTAFAGIGRPEKFFATLSDIGCRVEKTHYFADHHPYGERDIARLVAQSEAAGTSLVTTEKDFVRIPEGARRGVGVLTIAVEWEDEAALDAVLRPLVGDDG